MAGMENSRLVGCIRTQVFVEYRDSLDFLVNTQSLVHLVFHFLHQGFRDYNLEMAYYHQIRNPHSHVLKHYNVGYIQSVQTVFLVNKIKLISPSIVSET